MSCTNRLAVICSNEITKTVARSTKQPNVLADLESSVRTVEEALLASPSCSTGLVVAQRTFGIPVGPSGGPEILAVIHVDDFAYWYGHVVQHPKKENTFVALLVWSEKIVNATNVPLLFRRFHYWVKDRLCYEPCTIQHEDDAYAECASVKMAAVDGRSQLTHFFRKFLSKTDPPRLANLAQFVSRGNWSDQRGNVSQDQADAPPRWYAAAGNSQADWIIEKHHSTLAASGRHCRT